MNANTLVVRRALKKYRQERKETGLKVWMERVTDLETEHGVSLELNVVDRAVQDGVNAGAGILDAHALADTVLAASPAGVDLF